MLNNVELNIKRSNRRTISIYVERDGRVSILAPEKITEIKLNEIIKKKEYLIYKHLAKWKELNSGKIEREWVNGQSYLYLGRNYRLKILKESDTSLSLKNGFFNLDKAQINNANKLFIEFYKEKGLPKIIERVIYYKTKMGLEPKQIRIMDLKNRWASCSVSGNINFHWKCIMAPLSVIDYIVVHELAHLKHNNHTSAFWNEIDKVIPDYQKQIQWLREKGAGMSL